MSFVYIVLDVISIDRMSEDSVILARATLERISWEDRSVRLWDAR
jgi:hypothetical protein